MLKQTKKNLALQMVLDSHVDCRFRVVCVYRDLGGYRKFQYFDKLCGWAGLRETTP